MSESAHVAVKAVESSEEVVRFLFELFGSSGPMCWHANEAELGDPKSGLPKQSTINRAGYGRVFSDKADVQWRRQEKGWHITVLSSEKVSGTVDLPGEWEAHPAKFRLIGTKFDSKWSHQDYPRLIEYPDGTAERAFIEGAKIIDKHSGIVQFTRYIRFGGNQ